jgi:hypothetical protein
MHTQKHQMTQRCIKLGYSSRCRRRRPSIAGK